MAFSGFPFLLGFLPLLFCGYAAFSRLGPNWAKGWLIATSLLFYGWGAPGYLPLLTVSVAGNFLLLRAMAGSARPYVWTAVGVGLNLAVLAGFKIPDGGRLTPLGLSFFTFTQIGCLLHFAGGEERPPRFRDYALFAAFFPALLAGPILNAREALPQFQRVHGWRFRAEDFAAGSGFFVIGLLKKTLLADPLGSVVGAGFSGPEGLSLGPAWQAAMAYSLQLYFDFSGYTDMAVGLARVFGLRFPDNFDRPYAAESVIAYWQRWHMSLTRFLMTHVHAPMTMAVFRWRKRRGLAVGAAAQRTVSGFAAMIVWPVAATMVLVSLWHGPTWPYLAFGLLHTAFLVINHAWRLFRGPSLPKILSMALTYLCVLAGAVVFRAETLEVAGSVLAGMAGLHGLGGRTPGFRGVLDAVWLAALYAVVWFAPTTRGLMEAGEAARWGWRPTRGWAMAMGGAATLGLLAAGGTGEFLYFRF